MELRTTTVSDLETLFEFQLDKEANYLAAFTSKDPTDKAAYIKKWTRLLSNETIHSKVITVQGEIVGTIAKYEMEGLAEATYWIGKTFWGKGIASNALKQFLKIEQARPIHGRVAFDNIASQKVLEKNGFQKIGTEKGFSNARNTEIEEFVYELK